MVLGSRCGKMTKQVRSKSVDITIGGGRIKVVDSGEPAVTVIVYHAQKEEAITTFLVNRRDFKQLAAAL